MKNNLLTNILIAPNVISKEGVAFIMEHAKRQKKVDLSVFDPEQSNKTKDTKFSVDKKVRDTQMIDLEDIASEIIDLFRNVVTNVINPFYEFEVKDSELPQLLHYGVDGHYMPHCDGESLWKPPGNEPLIWRKSTDRDLSTVLFLNDDFEELILRYDAEDTYLYLDPPYFRPDENGEDDAKRLFWYGSDKEGMFGPASSFIERDSSIAIKDGA
jgi:hypothetical protein